MKAAVIVIGNEILVGQVQDTNSGWIAAKLRAIGVELTNILAVSDTADAIRSTLSTLEGRTDLVIMTGGLGPTSDDITRQTLAAYFDTELVFSKEVEGDIADAFKRWGRKDISVTNRTQAYVLKDSFVLRNPVGTAPGTWMERNGTVFVSLPGVPFEMKEMMTGTVLPRILALFPHAIIHQRTVLTHGIGESDLAERIATWEKNLADDISLAYLPSPGMVRLRLTVKGDDAQVLETRIHTEIAGLLDILGDAVFGFDEDTLEKIVGRLLTAQNQTLATAESCTGGAMAARITTVPGASNYFKGGIVAYANDVKSAVLGVPQSILDTHGAVSRETVEAMAAGARKVLAADWATAVSGIAGPSGGTLDKPVGSVWIAVASKHKIVSQLFQFGGRRDTNIERTVRSALNMLRKLLIEESRTDKGVP